jgi:hypothetical protein
VVLEAAGDAWKVVEAEIGGDEIVVLGAHPATAADGVPAPLRTRDGGEVALLPSLKTCVCRVIDLPGATADQIDNMMALRIELELPYPVAESTWACEPRMNGHGANGQVLLIAAASREIAPAEQALQAWGVRDAAVEFAPAGLAELALAADPSAGTVAVLQVEGDAALLVLAHGRSLCYVRRIGLVDPDDDSQLVREVNQSLFDYQLRSGNPRPERLAVLGGRSSLNESLKAQLELPATTVRLPKVFSVPADAIPPDALVSDYAACLGALLAMHRRLRGEASAAPSLCKSKHVGHAAGWRGRRGLLLGLNGGLLALALVLGAVAGSVRLHTAEKLIESGRPIIGGLEKLQEEVEILRYEEKHPRAVLDVLKAMAEALPPEIKVQSIEVTPKGNVTLTGKTGTVEAASDTAMAALRDSKVFVNPQFHGATKEQDGFGFRITCDLRGGAGK